MKKPYLIAEIGVNFYDTAKELGITLKIGNLLSGRKVGILPPSFLNQFRF